MEAVFRRYPKNRGFLNFQKLIQVHNFPIFDKKFSLRFLQMRVNRILRALRDFQRTRTAGEFFPWTCRMSAATPQTSRNGMGLGVNTPNEGIEAKHRDDSSNYNFRF